MGLGAVRPEGAMNSENEKRDDHEVQQLPEAPSPAPTPAAPPLAADPEDPTHVLLRMPLNVRSMSLAVLAVLAVLATLRWASAFFIPLLISVMFSYALSPLVDGMARMKIPRALSAAVLILGILGSMGLSVYAFSDDANELIETLPEATQKLRDTLRKRSGDSTSALDTVQKAATQLEQAAAEASPAESHGKGVQRVVIEKPRFNLRDMLWNSTMGLANLLGQVTVVTFLTYFLLLSGDTFRRKMVKITGPTLTNKKITVQALDEITGQIQRYLLVQLMASLLVGITTGLAFWALGLQHAAVWGIAAGILNLVPYIGSIVVTAGAALVAFLQFGTVNMALAVGGVSLLINTIEGNLLVPLLTSRASRMNPVAVFVGVLAWGWLWGVWGLLLGIPIMMVIKAVCDRVDDLKPVGELLGD
ncbi:MAG: AI-2E family transporter [Haliea sp.]|nr:MAG: AI-2E family transporter [Haliea sp.]